MVIDDFGDTEAIKSALKAELERQFNRGHSTLEFEIARCDTFVVEKVLRSAWL